MEFLVVNEVPGRLRVRLAGPVPAADVDALATATRACKGVLGCTVYPRIGSLAVRYAGGAAVRERVLDRLRAIDANAIEAARSDWGAPLAPRAGALLMDVATLAGSFLARRVAPAALSVPPGRCGATGASWPPRYAPFSAHGSTFRFSTPRPSACPSCSATPRRRAQTMFLLDLGETLEDYTRARSRGRVDLFAYWLSPETVQLVRGSDCERSGPGGLPSWPATWWSVRSGMPVCIDGVVERGCAIGEPVHASPASPWPCERGEGDDVFAGTAVEDGEIFVRVRVERRRRPSCVPSSPSSSSPSSARPRPSRAANAWPTGIVPWNFLLAGAVAATTRSLQKTACGSHGGLLLRAQADRVHLRALRHEPERQGGLHGQGVEALRGLRPGRCHRASTRPGTLTEATPEVHSRHRLQRLEPHARCCGFAACLEEHFPHPGGAGRGARRRARGTSSTASGMRAWSTWWRTA